MSERRSARPEGAAEEAPSTGDVRRAAISQIAFNALLFIVFLVLFVRAGTLPDSAWEPLGAGAFPRLALLVAMVFNALIIASEIRQLRATRCGGEAGRSPITPWLWRHRLVAATLGVFGAYTLTLPALGFRAGTFIFLLAAQLLLGPRALGARLVMLVIAAVFAFGVDALFREVFSIMLPRSRLF